MIFSTLFLLEKLKGRLVFLLALSFSISVLTVVVDPLAIKFLIDEGLANKNFNVIVYSVLAIVISNLLSVFLSYILSLKIKRASNYLLEQFVPLATHKYYKLNYQDVFSKGDGYYLSRVYEEPKKISEEFIPIAINSFKSCLTFFLGLVIAVYIAWEVTVILFFIVPILYYLAQKYDHKIKGVINIETEKEAELREVVSSCLSAFKTTQLFRLEKKVKDLVATRLFSFNKAAYNSNKTVSLFGMFSSLFLTLSEVAVLVFASVIVYAGRLTIGGMMGYLNAYARIMNSVNILSENIPAFSKYEKYIQRLQEIITISGTKDCKSIQFGDDIYFKKVSFKYNGIQIFNNINVCFNHGDHILIKGENGSGKSTLANIIAGFIPIYNGEVQLPSKDSVSALIEPYHFLPGTVKDNLKLDKLPPAKKRTVIKLLERYGIRGKLNNKVSELSYGQKKKLYIIMVMSKKSKICIYDEPLKGIDTNTRQQLFDDMKSFASDSTLIMISHNCVNEHLFDKVIEL